MHTKMVFQRKKQNYIMSYFPKNILVTVTYRYNELIYIPHNVCGRPWLAHLSRVRALRFAIADFPEKAPQTLSCNCGGESISNDPWQSQNAVPIGLQTKHLHKCLLQSSRVAVRFSKKLTSTYKHSWWIHPEKMVTRCLIYFMLLSFSLPISLTLYWPVCLSSLHLPEDKTDLQWLPCSYQCIY